MVDIQVPGASVPDALPGVTDPVWERLRTAAGHLAGRSPFSLDAEVRAIGLASLRTLALVAVAVVLVLVILPALLGAAGGQVASGL
jgi:hypothetical protein